MSLQEGNTRHFAGIVRPNRSYIFVLIIATVLRVGVVFIVAGHEDRAIINDASQYVLLSENLVEQATFSLDQAPPFTENSTRTIGYPAFLSLFYILAGHQTDVVLLVAVNGLLGILNVFLVMAIARYVGDRRIALVSGLLYAIAPATLALTGQVMTETLFTTLLLTATYTAFQFPRIRRISFLILLAAVVGFIFALSSHMRPISLYLVPTMLLPGFVAALTHKLSWRRFVLAAATLMMTYVVVLLPWFVRNQNEFGSPFFTSIANFNLYYYNAPSIEARRQGISIGEASAHIAELVNNHLAQQGAWNATPAQRNDAQGVIVLGIVTAHPVEAFIGQTLDMVNVFRPGYSTILQLFRDPASSNQFGQSIQESDFEVVTDLFASERLLIAIVTVYYGLLYSAAFVGLISAIARQKWALLTAAYLIPLPFLYLPGAAGNARFRVPIEGLLTLGAAYGIVTIFDLLQSYRRRRITPDVLDARNTGL